LSPFLPNRANRNKQKKKKKKHNDSLAAREHQSSLAQTQGTQFVEKVIQTQSSRQESNFFDKYIGFLFPGSLLSPAPQPLVR
jgi:hypothetical protein